MLSGILVAVASFVLGAACGSIPFGYIAGRIRGMDIRKHGSGNIGFTNVQRTIGWSSAAPVLLLDVVKGLASTALAPGIGLTPEFAGLGAICGHVFTPWLGFRGDKGVATTIGVTAFLCPRSLIAGLAVYLLMLLLTGFISLSSLVLAASMPPVTAVLYQGNLPLLLFTLGVCAIVFIRHQSNITRLLNHTEPRLGLWMKFFRRT